MDAKQLIQKYNVPGPRYTSYPTVPFWKKDQLNSNEWLSELDTAFQKFPDASIGIYIHLPFASPCAPFAVAISASQKTMKWKHHTSIRF